MKALKRPDGYLDRHFSSPLVATASCWTDTDACGPTLREPTWSPPRQHASGTLGGTFSEALTRPASVNSKAKLRLTQKERLEAAWKLILFNEERGNYSLRDVAEATGVGKSTVGNMRNILESGSGLKRNPLAMTGKEVKRGRRENRDHDPDSREEIVNRWRRGIRRALGDDPNQLQGRLFTALREGYPQIFTQTIPRQWAEEAWIVDELRVEAVEDFEF